MIVICSHCLHSTRAYDDAYMICLFYRRTMHKWILMKLSLENCVAKNFFHLKRNHLIFVIKLLVNIPATKCTSNFLRSKSRITYCVRSKWLWFEFIHWLIFIFQQIEFEWVLHVEVHSVLKNLHALLVVSDLSIKWLLNQILIRSKLQSIFRNVHIGFQCHCTATMAANKTNIYLLFHKIS